MGTEENFYRGRPYLGKVFAEHMIRTLREHANWIHEDELLMLQEGLGFILEQIRRTRMAESDASYRAEKIEELEGALREEGGVK